MNQETAKIKKIEKDSIVKTGERFLKVEIAIGKEVINWGYPIDTPEKAIKDDIKKLLKTMTGEKANAGKQAKIDAEDKQADKTIKNLNNLSI